MPCRGNAAGRFRLGAEGVISQRGAAAHVPAGGAPVVASEAKQPMVKPLMRLWVASAALQLRDDACGRLTHAARLHFRVFLFLACGMLAYPGARDRVPGPADNVCCDRAESRIKRARGFGLLFR